MYVESSDRLEGNAQFEGFCIDFIEKIAEKLGFNYTFKLSDDGAYGGSKKDEKGNIIGWDGMIAEVYDGVSNSVVFQ